jgi:eukaryotic-like serine/threonine-protein kinase
MGETAATGMARIVGRYAIFDEIASGGMATVYLGRLMGSGGFSRTIAIKRLHPQFAKDPEFVTMFLDEARLAARIRHPNVVPTLDVVASKGEVFLVMEYVQGESLSRLARALKARGERVPIPILLRIMSDALQGLHAAHEARDERGVPLDIVHRDMTPQNILVGVDGVGRLLDFGVAKAAGRAHTTREGQIKGKLGYMAPEQLTGTGVTRQTDVYAAAVVLWEMLAGQRLFAGGSEVDVIAKLLRRDIQPPSHFASGIPASLDDVVMRGLAPSVADRFATARDVCVALATCGVQEAGGMAVGEWVEGLASDALADRSAKIVAIETHSEADARPSVDPTLPPRGHSEAAATLAPPRLALSPNAHPSEPASAMLTATMATSALRSNVRRRIWGAGAALVVLVVGGLVVVVSAMRGGTPARSDTPSRSSSARVAPEITASSIPASAFPLVPPEVNASAVPESSTAPAPRAGTSAPLANQGPPRRATAPAAIRGAAAPPAVSKTHPGNGVFDSRE